MTPYGGSLSWFLLFLLHLGTSEPLQDIIPYSIRFFLASLFYVLLAKKLVFAYDHEGFSIRNPSNGRHTFPVLLGNAA